MCYPVSHWQYIFFQKNSYAYGPSCGPAGRPLEDTAGLSKSKEVLYDLDFPTLTRVCD